MVLARINLCLKAQLEEVLVELEQGLLRCVKSLEYSNHHKTAFWEVLVQMGLNMMSLWPRVTSIS